MMSHNWIRVVSGKAQRHALLQRGCQSQSARQHTLCPHRCTCLQELMEGTEYFVPCSDNVHPTMQQQRDEQHLNRREQRWVWRETAIGREGGVGSGRRARPGGAQQKGNGGEAQQRAAARSSAQSTTCAEGRRPSRTIMARLKRFKARGSVSPRVACAAPRLAPRSTPLTSPAVAPPIAPRTHTVIILCGSCNNGMGGRVGRGIEGEV